jgi:periplasmic glucans biosynthesis protein
MRHCRYANQRIGYGFYIKRLSALLLSVVLMLGIDVAYARSAVSNPDGQPFSHDTVIQLARELAQEPYKEPEKAPKVLTDLDYSTYRKINFQPDAAIWGKSPTRFRIQLFAPGFLFKNLVDIDVVENGTALPVQVSESSFSVPYASLGKTLAQIGKYAGIRLHYPINRDGYKDEFIVFQGASYFRAVSKGQLYGLSARGLAIDVAQPHGEEHALFKRFWIERPAVQQKAIVVHALLDSVSVAGA